jgi:uncharacterized protein YutE (UPF0331/DUF86 family)
VVDADRVRRLLQGIEADVRFLDRYVGRATDELLADDTALRGIKYSFITAIATAVGFRNLLVHQYGAIDDDRVIGISGGCRN